MKKTRNYDFQQFLHIMGPHLVTRDIKTNQNAKQTLDIFHVKTNNVKRVQVILRLKYKKKIRF